MRVPFFLIAFSLCSSGALSQDLNGFEKILLPAYGITSGVSGTTWHGELLAFNSADREIFYYPTYPGSAIENPPGRPPQIGTLRALFGGKLYRVDSRFLGFPAGPPGIGRVLYIERGAPVSLNLRIFEEKHPDAMTEIPVARESDFRTASTFLVNIPIQLPSNTTFRKLLRVYDPDQNPDGQVLIRLWNVRGGNSSVIAEQQVAFKIFVPDPKSTVDAGDRSVAGLIELDLERFANPLSKIDDPLNTSLAVEVVPLTANLRFWAMVTLTDDATQHVTTVTPH